MNSRFRTRISSLATAALLALLVPGPVQADHPQGEPGATVAFDHDGDNEWWVEVLVRTSPGDSVITMEARPSSGDWHFLRHMSQSGDWHKWGPNAPHDQFRIPPGDTVQFRATVMNGDGDQVVITSCDFTHPAGVEQCSSPPPPPGDFDATFSGVRGNEWWVQTHVSATGGAVEKVDVRLDGGSWKPLPKQSWGGHAASYHAPEGTVVQLRATAVDGATDLSDCYQWIPPSGQDAARVSCSGSQPPPPSDAFDATFTMVEGNEWWVQTQVTPNSGFTVTRVEVSRDGGEFMPLQKQSWGVRAYAASYHFPEGSVLQLRATESGGSQDLSACYRWIPPQGQDATPVACSSATEWRTQARATFSESVYDVSVGDADRDGRSETYVAGEEGLFLVTPAGRTAVSPLGEWTNVAVGDGDNDGRQEVYAIRWQDDFQGRELHRLSHRDGVWTDRVLHRFPDLAGPITLGDVDNDGRREVYVGHSVGQSAAVTRVQYDGVAWHAEQVVNFGDNGDFLFFSDIWVGDADRDGKLELAVTTGGRGYTLVWVVEKTTGGWTGTRIGHFSDGPAGIVVGDVDGNGRTEVVAADRSQGLHHYRFVDGAWHEQVLKPLPSGTEDIFLADGDDDGRQEIYAAVLDGRVYQVKQTPQGYTSVAIAAVGTGTQESGPLRVVVGDGDGDGRREVYSVVFDLDTRVSTVYETQVARQDFTATFSGVKGNEWWVQVSVSANEPLAGVDARVDCGAWVSLTDQGWGWAKSFHVPDGSKVDFRARSTTGAVDGSGTAYVWPAATPTSGC